MTDSKKRRRWKRAAVVLRRFRGIPKTTFYGLIRQGKIQSDCPTPRTTRICVGYNAGGETVNCLTTPQETPIDCRNCNIPR